MFQQRSPVSIKSSIFTHLREFNADYAEASYSGGNDEGGVDDILIYRSIDGERVQLALPEQFGYDHPLWQAFDELLSLEFGSWAGDFSANGVVTANVKANTLKREGEVSNYEPDGEEW